MKIINRKNKNNSSDSFWSCFLQKNGYNEATLSETAARLEKMPEDLQEALKEWDSTGVLPNLQAEGFTARELIEYFGLKEIAAILMIDWLRREPNEAKMALAEPVSKIVVDDECREEMMLAEQNDVNDEDEMMLAEQNDVNDEDEM